MPNFDLVGDLFAAAIEEWGTRLVAIPAGYAIGAWIKTLIAYIAALDRDARTDLRDLIGVVGGAIGLAVWFAISFLVD